MNNFHFFLFKKNHTGNWSLTINMFSLYANCKKMFYNKFVLFDFFCNHYSLEWEDVKE